MEGECNLEKLTSRESNLEMEAGASFYKERWFSSSIFAPRVDPTPPFWGTTVFFFYSSGQVVFLMSTPVATPPSFFS